MLAEIKTLLWLQWKLTRAMFRSRRLHVWARLGRILLMLLMLLFTLPFFLAMGGALGYALARLSPAAGMELISVVNTGMLFFWLLLPASYNAEVMERFEMSRLFVHPIRFRSVVAGSTIVSLLSMTGVWSLPILLGEIAGLTWHRPWLLPYLLAAALPTFAIMVLGGRLMDDLLDLVSGDRRLRGLLIMFLSLPFMALGFLNFYMQFARANPQLVEGWIEKLFGRLPALQGLSFFQGFDLLLSSLRPSRYLLWLPPGWGAAGMALPVAGRWAAGLGFLLLALAFAAGLLGVHAAVTRRLMQGAALRSTAQRIRSRERTIRLPGPPALGALLHKDWTTLRRSPILGRTLLSLPIVAVGFGVALWNVAEVTPLSSALRQAVPFLAAMAVLVSINIAVSNLTGNYFGAVDREGFAALMLTPADRRQILLVASSVTLLLCLAPALLLLVLVALFTHSWVVVPWGLLLAVCLHLGTAPAYILASILAPYRAPLQAWGGKGGNAAVLLAWAAASPPVLGLFTLPLFFWRGGVAVALLLAVAYSLGLYALTLAPLARLIDRRAHQILEAVSEQG